jgi:hypothetical protein
MPRAPEIQGGENRHHHLTAGPSIPIGIAVITRDTAGSAAAFRVECATMGSSPMASKLILNAKVWHKVWQEKIPLQGSH